MSRLDAYETRTSGAMTTLALLFLVVYGLPVVLPDLPAGLRAALEWANVAIWAAFAVDLAVRTWLADRRLRFLLRHPVDVLSVLLPMLRPLRVLRVFTAGQALLARRGGLVRTGQAVVVTAGLLILIGALAILDAERGEPDALIRDFPDALWWAMTTVTTVGYGDLYPVTPLGRAVAAALMVVGISVLGVVTATVAAWFVRGTADDDGAGTADADAGPGAGGRTLGAELERLLESHRCGDLTEPALRRAVQRAVGGEA